MTATDDKGASGSYFVERVRSALLRGGRLTKFKGKAASYAPGLGVSSPDVAIGPVSAPVLGRVVSALGASVSARALAAVAILAVAPISLSSTGARAGTCVGAGGVYTCSGAANAGGLDATQGITPVAPDDLTVTTQAGFGIDTSNNGAINAFTLTGAGGSANLTFTDNNASAITGGDSGIEAVNNGSGFLTITTTGAVTGTTNRGILAGNTAAGTSITINAQGDVLGNVDGIRAANLGNGALSITSQAATGTTLFGIYAFNNVDGTDVTVNAGGTVLGNDSGISANNLGSGALSVTSQAVTGTTQFGIFARNTAAGTSLTVNAQGDAFGGAEGIRARNLGSGALSVTSQAATGGTGRGIYARSFDGTDLTIDAQGDVSGQTEGIFARNTGSGALSVTSRAVTGITASGISARNDATGTSLTVNAQGDVSGGDYGINARNFGTAGMTITTSGDVTGTGVNGIGIFARNSAAGAAGSVVINQAANTTTTGSLFGIIVVNTGGSLTVNALGTTVSLAGDGIDAFSNVAGTDLIITANTVTGENNGIDVRNTGTGATSITTTGTVTGTTFAGILANNTTSSTSITINAQGNVFGDDYGIIVANSGTGALSITSQAVTATTGFGISAGNTAIGTSVVIDARGAVSGATDGILARNLGSAGLSITTQAVTSGAGAGIFAYNSPGGTSLTIDARGAVSGATDGIYARNDGTGPTTITTSGGVIGATGILITARANNVPTTINNFAAITGTGGVAINFQGIGNDTLNILPGSVINGTIDFGTGNDGLGGTNPNDIDTLNVAPGINAVFTFADTSGDLNDGDLQSAPEIVSDNVVFINGGTQAVAVAVDPTGFAAVGVALGSFISSIFNSIDNNGSAQPWEVSPAGGRGIVPAGGDSSYGAGRRLWVSGFGGRQKVEGSSNQAGIDNRFGGAITGVESGSGGSTFGVFGGYAVSNLDLEFNAGDVKFDSAFGGGYWKINTGTFNVNLAIVAGSAGQDTTRNVGGVDAKGESDGWFISPSITIAAPMEFYAQPVVFSGRVSYAGLFLDGYTETGVANPLTVSDRDVHILNTRAQINVPYTVASKDGSRTRLDLRAGVDAQFDAGSDNAALVVGGTALNFSADLDNEVAGFIGTTIAYTSASGMFSFSASGEVQSTFDGGYKTIGQVRGAVQF